MYTAMRTASSQIRPISHASWTAAHLPAMYSGRKSINAAAKMCSSCFCANAEPLGACSGPSAPFKRLHSLPSTVCTAAIQAFRLSMGWRHTSNMKTMLAVVCQVFRLTVNRHHTGAMKAMWL